MLGLWTERRAYLDAAGHVERCLSCLDFGVDMFRDFLFTCGVKKGVRWKWTTSAIRERINGKKRRENENQTNVHGLCVCSNVPSPAASLELPLVFFDSALVTFRDTRGEDRGRADIVCGVVSCSNSTFPVYKAKHCKIRHIIIFLSYLSNLKA